MREKARSKAEGDRASAEARGQARRASDAGDVRNNQREMEAAQRREAEELAEGMDGVAHTRTRRGERAQSNIILQRSMMDTDEDDDAHTPNKRRGERAQSSFF